MKPEYLKFRLQMLSVPRRVRSDTLDNILSLYHRLYSAAQPGLKVCTLDIRN